MKSGRLEQLQKMLQDNPDDAFILYALGQEYLKLENTVEALKLFTDLTEKQPEYTGTYYHLGKLYEQLGDFEKARATYKKGLDMTSKLGDRHNYNELQGALANLVD